MTNSAGARGALARRPGFREADHSPRKGTEGSRTRRWREMDSNHRSRDKRERCSEARPMPVPGGVQP